MIKEFLTKKLKINDKVVLINNNLGSCTDLEMSLISKELI